MNATATASAPAVATQKMFQVEATYEINGRPYRDTVYVEATNGNYARIKATSAILDLFSGAAKISTKIAD